MFITSTNGINVVGRTNKRLYALYLRMQQFFLVIATGSTKPILVARIENYLSTVNLPQELPNQVGQHGSYRVSQN